MMLPKVWPCPCRIGLLNGARIRVLLPLICPRPSGCVGCCWPVWLSWTVLPTVLINIIIIYYHYYNDSNCYSALCLTVDLLFYFP